MSGLKEALKTAGITKIQLAKLMSVNEKTIRRLGDELTPEIKEILSTFTSMNSIVEKAEKRSSFYVSKSIQWQSQVNQSIFDGHGRGVPVDGFVLISMGRVPEGEEECQVVTELAWLARLKEVCSHGFKGWTCKKCLH